MGILGLQPEVPQGPQGPVGQILTHEGYAKIALVDLGREASDALRASWPAARPFQSAGVIDSTWLPPLLGAGSTAASSLLARQRVPGDRQSPDADDHRHRGRIGGHGVDWESSRRRRSSLPAPP